MNRVLLYIAIICLNLSIYSFLHYLQLIKINEPDLVLFVGEALVGNDGVDQLRKFNQALADHSDVNDPHLIDGIVLTKFDTIDDKVSQMNNNYRLIIRVF